MKKDYSMVMDDKPVTLSLSRKRVYLNEERLDVKTASIGKKRKNSTFKVILYIIAVIAAGILLYTVMNNLIEGEVEGDPFQELDTFNNIDYRQDPLMDRSSLFLQEEDNQLVDLTESVTWVSGSMDEIEITVGRSGPCYLHLMWYGSVNDLMTRGISHLRIIMDSPDNYSLHKVDLVVLDINGSITDEVQVEIAPYGAESGRSVYDIHMDRIEMGAARNLQSGLSSSMKGTYIRFSFPDGISQGTVEISAEWGPDYYHESTQMGLIIGGICAMITLGALVIVYSRVAKDEACLTLDTDEVEYILIGDHKDISEAYLGISKITIPRMKGADERKKERPGITKGDDLIDKDEAIQIGKELKNIPGGSGKMIVHQCPECMGTELYFESGFMTGYKYHCKKCDYVGSFVIEKQVNFDQ